MFRISKDTPALYFTSVAAHRLPVFRTGKLKDRACSALDEARRSGNFSLFAYVIMPDHLHGIVGGTRKQSEIMRFINGITSRRVIDYLKATAMPVRWRNCVSKRKSGDIVIRCGNTILTRCF
jgi:REP element-mobilizing transposase RayT